jgi:hypothetical protein
MMTVSERITSDLEVASACRAVAGIPRLGVAGSVLMSVSGFVRHWCEYALATSFFFWTRLDVVETRSWLLHHL